jgi:hypothetical protein
MEIVMNFLLLTQLLAVAGLAICVAGLTWRWRWTARRPLKSDFSTPKGSPQKGALYAFTMGMMPWTKEVVRKKPFPYVRGVAFHMGIFIGLGALVISPWWHLLPEWARLALAVVTGGGAVLGLIGAATRVIEKHLRAISTPDDHASVLIVNIFLATTCIALLQSTWLPTMYIVSAVMLIYIPMGKIRHCIYFFFSRLFYGQFVGRRAVIHSAEATR